MSDRNDITVLIPSSVIPSHPSTHVLDWTIGSVRSQLFKAPIIVMLDGVRPEQEARKEAYEEFKRRLIFPLLPSEVGSVRKAEFSTFHHQAAMMRETLQQVTTPLILFIEQDWLLLEPIPWDAMAKTILDRDADLIRLHQTAGIHHDHEYLFAEKVVLNGIPLKRQRHFWAQPHIAHVDWYRKQMENFTASARTFLEDRLYGLYWNTPDRIYTYAPEGSIKRVAHTDGREKNPDGTPLVSKFEDKLVF